MQAPTTVRVRVQTPVPVQVRATVPVRRPAA